MILTLVANNKMPPQVPNFRVAQVERLEAESFHFALEDWRAGSDMGFMAPLGRFLDGLDPHMTAEEEAKFGSAPFHLDEEFIEMWAELMTGYSDQNVVANLAPNSLNVHRLVARARGNLDLAIAHCAALLFV